MLNFGLSALFVSHTLPYCFDVNSGKSGPVNDGPDRSRSRTPPRRLVLRILFSRECVWPYDDFFASSQDLLLSAGSLEVPVKVYLVSLLRIVNCEQDKAWAG